MSAAAPKGVSTKIEYAEAVIQNDRLGQVVKKAIDYRFEQADRCILGKVDPVADKKLGRGEELKGNVNVASVAIFEPGSVIPVVCVGAVSVPAGAVPIDDRRGHSERIALAQAIRALCASKKLNIKLFNDPNTPEFEEFRACEEVLKGYDIVIFTEREPCNNMSGNPHDPKEMGCKDFLLKALPGLNYQVFHAVDHRTGIERAIESVDVVLGVLLARRARLLNVRNDNEFVVGDASYYIEQRRNDYNEKLNKVNYIIERLLASNISESKASKVQDQKNELEKLEALLVKIKLENLINRPEYVPASASASASASSSASSTSDFLAIFRPKYRSDEFASIKKNIAENKKKIEELKQIYKMKSGDASKVSNLSLENQIKILELKNQSIGLSKNIATLVLSKDKKLSDYQKNIIIGQIVNSIENLTTEINILEKLSKSPKTPAAAHTDSASASAGNANASAAAPSAGGVKPSDADVKRSAEERANDERSASLGGGGPKAPARPAPSPASNSEPAKPLGPLVGGSGGGGGGGGGSSKPVPMDLSASAGTTDASAVAQSAGGVKLSDADVKGLVEMRTTDEMNTRLGGGGGGLKAPTRPEPSPVSNSAPAGSSGPVVGISGGGGGGGGGSGPVPMALSERFVNASINSANAHTEYDAEHDVGSSKKRKAPTKDKASGKDTSKDASHDHNLTFTGGPSVQAGHTLQPSQHSAASAAGPPPKAEESAAKKPRNKK